MVRASHESAVVAVALLAIGCGAEVVGGNSDETTSADMQVAEAVVETGADTECAPPEVACDGCSSGDNEWGRILGGDREDFANGVAADSSGSAVVVGSFARSMEFCGETVTPPSHYRGAYVVKYDGAGRNLWSVPIMSAEGPTLASGVAVDDDDHVLVTGNLPTAAPPEVGPYNTQMPRAVFVSKLSPDGEELWQLRFESSGSASGQAVSADSRGAVFVTGFMNDPSATENDYAEPFVAKATAQGEIEWRVSMSGTAAALGRDIAVDSRGNAVWVGSALSDPVTLSIGDTTVGPASVFVAKFSPEGGLLWARPLVVDVELSCDCRTHGHAITIDSRDRIIVVGESEAPGDGHHTAVPQEAFVKQLSPDGTPLWGALWTGSVGAAATNSRDEIALTGSFFGATNLGGGQFDARGFSDIFVARIDAHGDHLWSTAFGTYALESGAGVAFTPEDSLFVVGHVGDHHAGKGNEIDFGSGPLLTTDQTDAFLAKYLD